MKVVIQRSNNSNVKIDNKIYNEIDKGLVIFSCFTEGDTIEDINYIVKKIVNLRIFDDENGVMNKSIIETNGEILSISQFTLFADTKKGNRPSYSKALNGNEAIKLYDKFNEELNINESNMDNALQVNNIPSDTNTKNEDVLNTSNNQEVKDIVSKNDNLDKLSNTDIATNLIEDKNEIQMLYDSMFETIAIKRTIMEGLRGDNESVHYIGRKLT